MAACSPKRAETVEELMANPQHLNEVRARCRVNRAEVGEATCQAAAIALGKRMGEGDIHYTPHPVPFDSNR